MYPSPRFHVDIRVIALWLSKPAQINGDPVPDADRVVLTAMFARLGGDTTRRPEELFNFLPHKPTRVTFKIVSCVHHACWRLEAYKISRYNIKFTFPTDHQLNYAYSSLCHVQDVYSLICDYVGA